MNPPYWYRVIQHFENRRYISNGLTLPFLIGSRSLIEPNEPLLSIEQILSEANDPTHLKPLTVLRCGNIGEFVFGLMDSETLLMQKSYPKLYYQIGHLIVTDNSLNDVVDFHSLCSKLTGLYQPLVAELKFSKNNGEWTGFTGTDRTRILEVGVN